MPAQNDLDHTYLPVDEIIKRAKTSGVYFGFGSPYNRIRYYIKKGILPNMVRRSAGRTGGTTGHLPTTTIDTLLRIQELKEKGMAMPEIKTKLEAVKLKSEEHPQEEALEEKLVEITMTLMPEPSPTPKPSRDWPKPSLFFFSLIVGLALTGSALGLMNLTKDIKKVSQKPLLVSPVNEPKTLQAVLAETTDINDLEMDIALKTFINNNASISGTLDVVGNLTAPNIIYSLIAGTGIAIGPGQNPTVTNTGVLSVGGSTGVVALSGSNGITVSGTSLSLSSIPNSALANSKITLNAGSNLTGGGDISLGSSGSLALKDSISITTLAVTGNSTLTTATVSGTLGVGGEASISSKLNFNYLGNIGKLVWSPTFSRTVTLPDDTGTICITTGNCAGLGGTVAGSGTQNYITKWNNAGGTSIGDSLLYDNGTNIGFGTTTPLGTFDIRGSSGITPIATISGQSSFAALVVDNKGVGDIFTASSSGLNRFVITQNGQIGVGTTVPAASSLLDLTSTTQGFLAPRMTTVQRDAISSPATGLFVYNTTTNAYNVYNGSAWVAVGGGSASKWQIDSTNGFIVPADVTQSFGLGATATTSAFLHFNGVTGVISNPGSTTGLLNIPGSVPFEDIVTIAASSSSYPSLTVRGNSTQPSASISGTNALATLIVDNNAIGDVFTASTSGLNRFVINKNGNVGIGTTNPTSIVHIRGASPTLFIQGTDTNTTSLGLSYSGNVARGGVTYNGSATDALEFTTGGGLGTGNRRMIITSTGLVGINTESTPAPAALLDVRGIGPQNSLALLTPVASISGRTGMAALVVDNSGTGDIFTASSSGLSRFVITQNGNVGIGSTAPSAQFNQVFAGTTTNGALITGNGLTTGNLLGLTSTSISQSTGKLVNIDFSPGGATTYTGNLVNINVGAMATISGQIFNIQDNASNIFSVNQNAMVSAIPTSFTAAGDVAIAYDINFTNPTASFIKSAAPLYLQAGETFNSSDLTLKTFYKGNVVVDSEAFVAQFAATVSSQLQVGTSSATPNIGSLYVTNNAVRGKAAVIINPTETTDLFTASAAGVGKFVIQNSGNTGIGTLNPRSALDVVLSSTATSSAFIENSNTASAITGLTIKLGSTTNDGTSHYINFLDLNGKLIGDISGNNGTGVLYQLQGIADFGEYMHVDMPMYANQKLINANLRIEDWLPPGTVVCQTQSGVKPCEASESARTVGVVSNTTGFLGGVEGPDSVIVGFLGQIRVRLASGSGQTAIQPGDFVGVDSTNPGTVSVANNRGYVVGLVIENPKPDGTVLVKVSPAYYEGPSSLAESQKKSIDDLQLQIASFSGNLSPLSDLNIATLSAQFGRFSDSLKVLGTTQLADTTIGGSLTVGLIHIDDLGADISSLTGNLSLQNGAVTINNQGDITTSGLIKAKTVVTDGLSLKDSATGEYYCLTITNGQIDKKKGACQ